VLWLLVHCFASHSSTFSAFDLTTAVACNSASLSQRGGFKDTTPDVLLATVLRTLIARTSVRAEDIGEVRVGNVLQHGAGAGGSRIAQMLAGMPPTVPLSAVNRQCSSGLQAVADVAASIKSGYYDVGIAAGVESMSLSSMSASVPQVCLNIPTSTCNLACLLLNGKFISRCGCC
jgi:acetyl-CoA acetyltransferase